MYQLSRLPILKFIDKFKQGFANDEIVKIFTQGNCYHFAIILKNIYTEGRIVHNRKINHFMLEYADKYYDITGEVKSDKNDCEYWDTLYYTDSNDYNLLMRDCVLKIDYYPYDKNEFCKKM